MDEIQSKMDNTACMSCTKYLCLRDCATPTPNFFQVLLVLIYFIITISKKKHVEYPIGTASNVNQLCSYFKVYMQMYCNVSCRSISSVRHVTGCTVQKSEKWADYGLAEVKTLAQHFFPFNKKMFDQITAEFSLLKVPMK